jgi:peptidoglycan/LPS O-acetylase OafA/YrhL
VIVNRDSLPVEDLKPLTSLRFVAAMMIVLLHAKGIFAGTVLASLPSTMVQGVSFFFVLSGFILTHVYMSKPFPGYTRFMKARIARLWPVHAFSLLLLVALLQYAPLTYDGPGLFSKWVTLGFNLTLTQAIVPFMSYVFSWNAVSWSISTEMFFYLMFPLLLRDLNSTWHRKLLGSAMIVASVYLALHFVNLPMESTDANVNELTIASFTYANPLVRGFEFCLGMAAWVWWHRSIRISQLSAKIWTLIELCVLIAAACWIWKIFPAALTHVKNAEVLNYLSVSGSSYIFAFVIMIFAAGKGLIGHLLSHRVFVFLGEISFSIYMLHQVAIRVAVEWFHKDAVRPEMFLGGLICLAAASYLVIEKPCRDFIMRFQRFQISKSTLAPAKS